MIHKTQPISTNIRIAQVLLGLAAASALLAGIGSITNVTSAADATVVVELWRVIGFFTFAALFGVLARAPQSYRSLWAIVILNKLALSIAGLFMQDSDITGASDLVIFDGGLTVLLIASSFLAGVWKPTRRS